MIKTVFSLFAASFAILLAAGCISVKYDGKNYEPTKNVKVFEEKSKIPAKNYTVMGVCTGSADYNQFSKEEIMKKIAAKAESEGADAVLLKDYAVVPAGGEREQQLMNTTSSGYLWADGSPEITDWNRVHSDFDQTYGTVGKQNNNSTIPTYRRIIWVQFIKYNK